MKKFLYRQIGGKIAYYRKLKCLTQEELAKRISVSVSTLSKIERGKYNNNIPLSLMIDIAEGLNVELVMLVTFDEKEKIVAWSD